MASRRTTTVDSGSRHSRRTGAHPASLASSAMRRVCCGVRSRPGRRTAGYGRGYIRFERHVHDRAKTKREACARPPCHPIRTPLKLVEGPKVMSKRAKLFDDGHHSFLRWFWAQPPPEQVGKRFRERYAVFRRTKRLERKFLADTHPPELTIAPRQRQARAQTPLLRCWCRHSRGREHKHRGAKGRRVVGIGVDLGEGAPAALPMGLWTGAEVLR
jgi:hypothetical protein